MSASTDVPVDPDVVVVGSGIAGGALAAALARGGLGVMVLEREHVYRDKVRGELVQPWGVAEAQRLGVHDTLLAAGGHHSTRMVRYDETTTPEEAETRALALDDVIPGVPGMLNIGHPEASQALLDAAVAAGATVVRGVSAIDVTPGREPAVSWETEGGRHHARCRIVVGADGRASSVRAQMGIELRETVARTMCAGLLVDAVPEWPLSDNAAGTEGDVHFFVIPRQPQRARLYLFSDIRHKRRFTGAERQRHFLDAFDLRCLPLGQHIASSRPAGPCASYPMTDAWCDRPVAEGVVLVGDAAGWSDPVIGQGLSVALRDARTLAEILFASSDWSVPALAPYVQERGERMRRLRVSAFIATELRCTFGPTGARRRQRWAQRAPSNRLLLAPILAYVVGPETAPPEAFAWTNVEDILAE